MINMAMIWAQTQSGVIGKDNAMPWHLPADFAFFRRQTLGKPVIMGRNTFASIGRALPGRQNIVISRQPHWQHPGVQHCTSLEHAMSLAVEHCQRLGQQEYIVMGGAQVYQQALPMASRLYVTWIDADLAGDAFAPAIAAQGFLLRDLEHHQADARNAFDMRFATYERALGSCGSAPV